MSNFRKKRIADLLLSFLGAELLRSHDPRVSQVTLTGLEITRDLKLAKIFWVVSASSTDAKDQVYNKTTDEKRIAEVQAALDLTVFELRKLVAKELNLRYTPQLKFIFDHSMEQGSKIEALLKEAGF